MNDTFFPSHEYCHRLKHLGFPQQTAYMFSKEGYLTQRSEILPSALPLYTACPLLSEILGQFGSGVMVAQRGKVWFAVDHYEEWATWDGGTEHFTLAEADRDVQAAAQLYIDVHQDK